LVTIQVNFYGTPWATLALESQLYGYQKTLSKTINEAVQTFALTSSTYNIGNERVTASLTLYLAQPKSGNHAGQMLDDVQLAFLEYEMVQFINTRLATNQTATVLEWQITSSGGSLEQEFETPVEGDAEGGEAVLSKGQEFVSETPDFTFLAISGRLVGVQHAQQRYEGDLNFFARTVETILDAEWHVLAQDLEYQSQLTPYATTMGEKGRYAWFQSLAGITAESGRTHGSLGIEDDESGLEAFYITFGVLFLAGMAGMVVCCNRQRKAMLERKDSSNDVDGDHEPRKAGKKITTDSMDGDSMDDDEPHHHSDNSTDDDELDGLAGIAEEGEDVRPRRPPHRSKSSGSNSHKSSSKRKKHKKKKKSKRHIHDDDEEGSSSSRRLSRESRPPAFAPPPRRSSSRRFEVDDLEAAAMGGSQEEGGGGSASGSAFGGQSLTSDDGTRESFKDDGDMSY